MTLKLQVIGAETRPWIYSGDDLPGPGLLRMYASTSLHAQSVKVKLFIGIGRMESYSPFLFLLIAHLSKKSV
jgi:hypothetical protein